MLYTLPKSRTTQRLFDGRNIEKAWQRVCTFIDGCTAANSSVPDDIDLTVHSAAPGDVEYATTGRILSQTKALFGEGVTRPSQYSYPDGAASKETTTEWTLTPADLPGALNYLVQGQPWPALTFGAVELLICYRFKLLDPVTKNELPDQSHDSRLMVWLSRSCCCSPDLFFPFVNDDSLFHRYLHNIQEFLPFALEKKYLRAGIPDKSGTSYRLRKIDVV